MDDHKLPEKKVVFDRDTHDYAAYLGGEIVGYFVSYQAAYAALSEQMYKRLTALKPVEQVADQTAA